MSVLALALALAWGLGLGDRRAKVLSKKVLRTQNEHTKKGEERSLSFGKSIKKAKWWKKGKEGLLRKAKIKETAAADPTAECS